MRMCYRLLIIILALVLSVAHGKTSTESPNIAAKRVVELLQKLQTFEANFHQKVYDARKRLVNETKGKFYLSRPGRFRWHVTSPYHELLIADRKELWAVDYDLEQVTVQNIDDKLGDTPALLLSQVNTQLDKQYFVKYIGLDAEQREVYQLKPKDNSSLFDALTLVFKKEQMLELWLRDSLGQLTMVYFNDQAINHIIDEKMFSYTPEKSMDLIDIREQHGR